MLTARFSFAGRGVQVAQPDAVDGTSAICPTS
jgi:hypothetical protein